MWLARNKDNSLLLFVEGKPENISPHKSKNWKFINTVFKNVGDVGGIPVRHVESGFPINEEEYQNVTYENSPIMVELYETNEVLDYAVKNELKKTEDNIRFLNEKFNCGLKYAEFTLNENEELHNQFIFKPLK